MVSKTGHRQLLGEQCGAHKEISALQEDPLEGRGDPPDGLFSNPGLHRRGLISRAWRYRSRSLRTKCASAEGAFLADGLALSLVSAGADQYPPTGNLVRDSFYAGIGPELFPSTRGGLKKGRDVGAESRGERQTALQYEDLKRGIEIEVRTTYLDLMTQKGILRFS